MEAVRMDLAGLEFIPTKGKLQIPHEYLVRNAANETKYVELFEWIKADGVWERFGRGRYCYLYCDGYKYWAMTDVVTRSVIINRVKV